MGTIHEWYGYLAGDTSIAAAASATKQYCPFLADDCQKTGGVCSVEPSPGNPIVVCPIRLYFDQYRVLREIAAISLGHFNPVLDSSRLPELVDGNDVRDAAASA